MTPNKSPEPEPEKPPPPPPKIEPPKEEIPKPAETPPPKLAAIPTPAHAPPVQAQPIAAVAPPPVVLPDFNFSDGAKPVETGTNAAAVYYKNMVEYALRSNWEPPEDIMDTTYVAEVEIQVDKAGRIIGSEWKRSSRNQRWNDSIKKAIGNTRSLNRPPPRGFPEKILIRFDLSPASTNMLAQ